MFILQYCSSRRCTCRRTFPRPAIYCS